MRGPGQPLFMGPFSPGPPLFVPLTLRQVNINKTYLKIMPVGVTIPEFRD